MNVDSVQSVGHHSSDEKKLDRNIQQVSLLQQMKESVRKKTFRKYFFCSIINSALPRHKRLVAIWPFEPKIRRISFLAKYLIVAR